MYIYGASGHGKVIAEIAEESGAVITGFIDLDINKNEVLNYEVIHTIPTQKIEVIIAIGNNAVRKKLVNENDNFEYDKLIHPRANVSKRTTIGEGSVVMAGVSINADVVIGNHCIINTNASVDHDCKINNFVHISPNVALAGNVEIGEGAHIGIGTCVIQGIKIGKWCTIGAGTVVIKDVPDGVTLVGNPGRIIK
ncbi:acetyltransferase [Flavobacterium sp. xlx-214]|uniref:acetyltransferase n=1 Tax=unclassified Flavobacterium TaxID=196869 RepID=UPI0013D36024|nr:MULTISPECIES: acetyltransferase [unclassified Flavobacterium]MBA5794040.1 acetyltransferase [Flavobacterium sp. xlx-221]QMI83145.1 acetyltransferase [Flavobacterium sp. xlx-214]